MTKKKKNNKKKYEQIFLHLVHFKLLVSMQLHCCCGKRHVRVADSSSTREVCGYPDQGVFAPTGLHAEPSSSSQGSTSALGKYLKII